MPLHPERAEDWIRRDEVGANRAFPIRFAWYPIAHDRGFIFAGADTLKARFSYGLDPRDQAAKGGP